MNGGECPAGSGHEDGLLRAQVDVVYAAYELVDAWGRVAEDGVEPAVMAEAFDALGDLAHELALTARLERLEAIVDGLLERTNRLALRIVAHAAECPTLDAETAARAARLVAEDTES